MTSQKILLLIDVWESLTSNVEQAKIFNICKFLNKIKNNPQWTIYYNCGSSTINQSIKLILQDCTNAFNTNDSLTVFNNTHSYKTYYYAGFHTNLCLFENELGIQKMLEISVPSGYEFYILQDLTCGLDLSNSITAPVDVPELKFLNCSNCKQTEVVIEQNLRKLIIDQKSLNSDNVLY